MPTPGVGVGASAQPDVRQHAGPEVPWSAPLVAQRRDAPLANVCGRLRAPGARVPCAMPRGAVHVSGRDARHVNGGSMSTSFDGDRRAMLTPHSVWFGAWRWRAADQA